MASHQPNAPLLPPSAHYSFNDADDVLHSTTQLSIDDSCDSKRQTSNHLTFACQMNRNLSGKQVFPLGATTSNYVRKISAHKLLNCLQSQQIVNNIEIFENVQSRPKMSQDTRQFPLKPKQSNKFPIQNNSQTSSNYSFRRKDVTSQPMFYVGNSKSFLSRTKVRKEKQRNRSNVKRFRNHHNNFKSKNLMRIIHHTNCKQLTGLKTHKQIVFRNKLLPTLTNEHRHKQFPVKVFKTETKFPLDSQFQTVTNKKLLNLSPKLSKNYRNDQSHLISITTFPLQMLRFKCVRKFPLNSKVFHIEHSARNDRKISKNAKIKNSWPSVSMTQYVQNMKSFDNEHVSQVQDAPVGAMENPRSPTIIENSKQTPPRTAAGKGKHVDDSDDDIHKLADSNSINNSQPDEVGYYAEKIERLQDAIVSLFERIQNSLITGHKNDRTSNTNATEHENHGHTIRFALTPPMSVTSVRNAESITADNKEFPYEKLDLGDLCVGHHVVDCSDVRDTLTEAVDCGNTKELAQSTGSFLVKSEEPASPCTLNPPTPPTETDNTSLEYKSHILLPDSIKFEKNFNDNLILDSGEIIDTQKNTENDTSDTGLNAPQSNSPRSASNEMTVTCLNKIEHEPTSQIKTNSTTEPKNNISVNNTNSNEMKFEMHKIKAALPSSVPERAPAKLDSFKPAANNTTNSRRLSLSTNASRHHNDNVYALRSQLRSESSNLAAGRRASLKPSPLPDIRSSDLNDVSSKRASLNLSKTASTPSAEQTLQRRPSLGSLRSTQSTSQLSVDLPRYTPLPVPKQTDKTVLSVRAASIDSSLSDVLPERTRLRRQRRLRVQDSPEESEDAIERLNRLRARISASLSEVKGVLKQYSTEAENDTENQIPSALNTLKETNENEQKDGAVVFRFVKKVRRRSLFAEDDDTDKQKIETTNDLYKPQSVQESQLKSIDETDHCQEESGRAKNEIETGKSKDEQFFETSDIKLETSLYTLREEAPGTVESKDETDHCKLESSGLKEIGKEQLQETTYEVKEDHKTLKTSLRTLQEEVLKLGEKHVGQTRNRDEHRSKYESENKRDQEVKGAVPKLTISAAETKSEGDNAATHKKLKKKIIIKHKDAKRRASLAAVEGSKIEPPVKLAVPNKIHRRPSDSEAVVKKKILTAKLNTSGAVEEVTPKPKIVKVKDSSPQNNSSNNNNSTQLATMQMKLQEEDFAVTATNVKSDDQSKSCNKDNQSIVSDKNQDVLVPKLADLEKQQQLKNEIVRQADSWLPTQSLIDEAASLNEKTNENSVLKPKQKQQQQQQYQHQQQHQQEENRKATIKSTATKFISNDLQADGAMLENLTTAISSPAASEANGQETRETVVPATDYHDLLQTEIALNKPSATKSVSGAAQLSNKVESTRSKATAKTPENLDKYQTTPTEQQGKQPATQHQQVLRTTDVAIIKTDDNNNSSKREELKATATLKEPCKESTTTSAHVAAEQQQRVGDEQSATNDTNTTSSPHNSISCTSDIAHQTTTATALSATESGDEKTTQQSIPQRSKMPELQLAPAPVQTADIISQPEHHKKKIIIKNVVRQTSVDQTKRAEARESKSPTKTQPPTHELSTEPQPQNPINEATAVEEQTQLPAEPASPLKQADEAEQCPESAEVSESSTPQSSEEASGVLDTPKKERIVKKKVIIKRQKRRLSIGENFFHTGGDEQAQNAEIETLEKPIAFVSDDEAEHADEKDQEAQGDSTEHPEEKKPLRSCILRKEYNIGDEVLYAERFKKTQIKWRRGRIKERITSISYLLDIDGKDVSSHINYLKKFTGRKVSFGGKEYLEIDYEQLAEEEEKAERLKKRSYSIWNMV